MGHAPADWEDDWGVSPLVDAVSGRPDDIGERGGDMDIPSSGGGDRRGNNAGGGDLLRPPLEHHHTIHCDKDHYGPVSVDGATFKGVALEVVVGIGGNQYGGDTVGGVGGGGGEGLEVVVGG